MTLEVLPAKQTNWKSLPDEGCINVRYKPLLKQDHFALAILRFENGDFDGGAY